MIRKQLIKQMVKNYYDQVEIVSRMERKPQITLRQYLQGIKDTSPVMTQEEVEYGVSLPQAAEEAVSE